ncbi:MAG: hypothetical protein WAT68_11875, partial [Candidatus Nitrotoga sp.]
NWRPQGQTRLNLNNLKIKSSLTLRSLDPEVSAEVSEVSSFCAALQAAMRAESLRWSIRLFLAHWRTPRSCS